MVGFALLVGGLAGCGEDHHEESFENYGECYEHLREEGRTEPGTFMECDEMFMPTYADNMACVAFYDDFSQIPMTAITTHCDGMAF
jgi:hypothetical protein